MDEFATNVPVNVKLSKTQVSKMRQSGGFSDNNDYFNLAISDYLNFMEPLMDAADAFDEFLQGSTIKVVNNLLDIG